MQCINTWHSLSFSFPNHLVTVHLVAVDVQACVHVFISRCLQIAFDIATPIAVGPLLQAFHSYLPSSSSASVLVFIVFAFPPILPSMADFSGVCRLNSAVLIFLHHHCQSQTILFLRFLYPSLIGLSRGVQYVSCKAWGVNASWSK